MNDKSDVKLNPWHPMSNPVDLKTLGKFSEEVNELGAIIARCIIQGIDGSNPDTGEINKAALEKEIADVVAGIRLTVARFKLDFVFIHNRSKQKEKRLKEWHDMA